MEISRVKALEIKLREMLKLSKQYQAEKNPNPTKINTGYIIRRRKGEIDKRISVEEKHKATTDYQFFEISSKRLMRMVSEIEGSGGLRALCETE